MGESDPDPFGEKAVPWWRTVFRGKGRAPKRYAGVAGALGPIVRNRRRQADGKSVQGALDRHIPDSGFGSVLGCTLREAARERGIVINP